MDKIAGTQVKRVTDLYAANNSILETARAAGLSTVKVRKILITEGLWESSTSVAVGKLLKQGMTSEEIAGTLHMTVKNVQAYMPYERGIYGGGELSGEAKRAGRYRIRMKHAASAQVVNSKDKSRLHGEKGETVNMVANKGMGSEKKRMDVLRLHLELDMEYADEAEMETLKKYGAVSKTIARDILVPADITLHALNYAILRMFGWQNGHLHNFSLPDDVFKDLTENSFVEWAKMAGVYFRFPTENYDDIYWDDDYREGESIKSWMRRKYTGPYKYKGYGEHYLMNQMEVEDMFRRWNEITVREFNFSADEQPEPYKVKLRDAAVDQVEHAFADVYCRELIERLPVADILYVKDSGKAELSDIREYVKTHTGNSDVDDLEREYNSRRFGSAKQKREYLESMDIPVKPVTDWLIYSYDYGDNWKVLITCEDTYHSEENGVWKNGKGEIESALDGFLEDVISDYRPVCIRKDGIELVDDVGGIYGFCDMLKTIYETDDCDEDAMSERENTLAWAEMMGWTGRKISTGQTL